MTPPRARFPSPLAGEGAERPRREAGEGAFAVSEAPSPGSHALATLSREGRGTTNVSLVVLARRETRSLPEQKASLVRRLRRNMTDTERKIWFALRDRRFAKFKFRRQVSMGPFVADFICFDRKLVIEIDGGQHAESLADRRRDRWFAANGFRVVRFWNNDVLRNLEGVLTRLLEELAR